MCKDPSQHAVQKGVDEHLKLVMENNPSITSKDEAIGLCKIRQEHSGRDIEPTDSFWPGVSPDPSHPAPSSIDRRCDPLPRPLIGLEKTKYEERNCTEQEYAAKAAAGWGPLNCEHLGNHKVTGEPLFPQKTLYTKGMANQLYDNRVGCLEKGPFAGWTAPTANLENASDMNTQNCVSRAVDLSIMNQNGIFPGANALAELVYTSEFFRCQMQCTAHLCHPLLVAVLTVAGPLI